MDLRQFRYSRGIQRKFAVANVGICGKHLNDIEAGRVNLTDNVEAKLASFYRVDVKAIRTMYEEGRNGNSRGKRKAKRALKEN